ncbi:MAG: YjbQ family protein [Clostridia bacterium]|nr:YjbQ family protein [Clostridia bacterium]
MEFKVFQKEIEVQSRGWIPTFHDVSREIREIVAASGVKNGTVCVASHHTTCSVMVQECSHDVDSFDLEFLQHDLLDIMRKLVPDFREEHQYRHPGPVHAQFGRYVDEPGDFTSMNTDGQLRSVFFGRSETRPLTDGGLYGGEFAHVYFIDWDQVRARHRQINVTVMGTTEDVGDRKWNGGEVVNTLHKFSADEKAYDFHYDMYLTRNKEEVTELSENGKTPEEFPHMKKLPPFGAGDFL